MITILRVIIGIVMRNMEQKKIEFYYDENFGKNYDRSYDEDADESFNTECTKIEMYNYDENCDDSCNKKYFENLL